MIGTTLHRAWTWARGFDDVANRLHLLLAALVIAFWLCAALMYGPIVDLLTPGTHAWRSDAVGVPAATPAAARSNVL